MRRALLVLAVLSLTLTACGGGGSGSDTSSKTPAAKPTYLGTTAGAALLGSPALLTAETRRMARVGVTTLRAPVYWSGVEPARGRFDWGGFDFVVAAAARAHLALPARPARHAALGRVGPGRDRVAAPAPGRLRRLRRRRGQALRVERLVLARAPERPKLPVRAWQIWNEPNHVYYWRTQPFAPGYVTLARAARAAIKGADPSATVVMAGFADRSWELIAAGLPRRRQGDLRRRRDPPVHVQGHQRGQDRDPRTRRAAEGRRSRPPVWATEVTWSSGQGKVAHPLGFETTASDQARRLAAALPALAKLRRSQKLERIYWESWATRDANRGNPFDFSGLLHVSASGAVTAKPAYKAYVRFAKRCAHGC